MFKILGRGNWFFAPWPQNSVFCHKILFYFVLLPFWRTQWETTFITKCNKVELQMAFEAEWYVNGNFLLLEYKDFWLKYIKIMVAQGFSVLVLIKFLCIQCEQIFASKLLLDTWCSISSSPSSSSVKKELLKFGSSQILSNHNIWIPLISRISVELQRWG